MQESHDVWNFKVSKKRQGKREPEGGDDAMLELHYADEPEKSQQEKRKEIEVCIFLINLWFYVPLQISMCKDCIFCWTLG